MDIITAIDTLQADHDAEMSKGEILAELGMSAFTSGAREPGDAMAIAHMVFNEENPPDPEMDAAWDFKLKLAQATVDYYESLVPDPQDLVPIGIDPDTGNPIVGFGADDMPLRRCNCGTVVEVPAPCGSYECMIVHDD